MTYRSKKVLSSLILAAFTISASAKSSIYQTHADEYEDTRYSLASLSLNGWAIRPERTTQPQRNIRNLPQVTLAGSSLRLRKQYNAKIDVIPESKVPQSIQLTDTNTIYKKSVGNQLQLGTCASFAVVDALLYAHGQTLSPAYLNVAAKKLYALDCANDGLDIGMAMKCAAEKGTIMDFLWPYQGYYSEVEQANKHISNAPQPTWDVCVKSPYTDSQDKGLVKFAFKKIKSLFLSDNKSERAWLIRDAIITHKSPVIISVPVQWNQEWRATGKINTLLEQIDGWHAISICGFNEEEREFSFKNSWGSEWAMGGYGTISYEYIINHAREAWLGYGPQLKS